MHLFKLLLLITFMCVVTPRSDRVKRVIGGGNSHRGQWPWLVSLQAKIVTKRFMGIFPTEHAHIVCGGALINSRWVLTAAHCFMPDGNKVPRGARYPWNWTVRLGTVDLKPDFRDRFMHALGRLLHVKSWIQVERGLDTIAIHPRYSSYYNWKNDIALVKLSKPVKDYKYISPIPLPRHNDPFPSAGDVCVAKGWGCSSQGGRVSGKMRHANLTVYSSNYCTRLYQTNMATRVCAGVSGSSICEGDSGGPLVCQLHGQWVHAGIASFTRHRSPQLYPSVFTKTAAYTQWIAAVVYRYK